MSLLPKDIKKIAHLARLAISDEDVHSLSQDLTRILNLVEEMSKADTKNIPPLAHPFDQTQPMRKDVVTETDQHILFQSIAPQTAAGLYIVPQVIDTE